MLGDEEEEDSDFEVESARGRRRGGATRAGAGRSASRRLGPSRSAGGVRRRDGRRGGGARRGQSRGTRSGPARTGSARRDPASLRPSSAFRKVLRGDEEAIKAAGAGIVGARVAVFSHSDENYHKVGRWAVVLRICGSGGGQQASTASVGVVQHQLAAGMGMVPPATSTSTCVCLLSRFPHFLLHLLHDVPTFLPPARPPPAAPPHPPTPPWLTHARRASWCSLTATTSGTRWHTMTAMRSGCPCRAKPSAGSPPGPARRAARASTAASCSSWVLRTAGWRRCPASARAGRRRREAPAAAAPARLPARRAMPAWAGRCEAAGAGRPRVLPPFLASRSHALKYSP